MAKIGSKTWNNEMFLAHPTPYLGIAGWIEKRRVRIILKKIERYCEVPNKIIELGCESGYLLKALVERFPKADVYGLDISDIALTQARKRLDSSPVTLIQADMCEPIPIKENFDIILCSETLEHIPEYSKALTQLENLSQKESYIILTVPLEALKNNIKRILRKLGLMNIFFKGIEEGFSAWHVQDFSEKGFKTSVQKYFDILSYQKIWGLHQLIVAKKKNL